MSTIRNFFKPSWKKLYWFFLVFFVAQAYSAIVINIIPSYLMANFVNFVLNPATTIAASSTGLEPQMAVPFAATLNALWQYFLGTILAKEISKDKE